MMAGACCHTSSSSRPSITGARWARTAVTQAATAAREPAAGGGGALPQQRGGLPAHLGWGRAEHVGHGAICDSPGRSEEQGGNEGSHDRQPEETSHCGLLVGGSPN